MVRQFYLTVVLFLFLRNVNCFQNKTNHDHKQGFLQQFLQPTSNGLSNFIKPVSNGLSNFIKPGSNEWSNFIKPGLNGDMLLSALQSNGLTNSIKPDSNGLSNFITGFPSNLFPNNINNPSKPTKNTDSKKPNKRQFAKVGLEAHNKRRITSPHYGTKLVLDDTLCKDAQSYANKLARRDGGLQHARGTGQGENLSWQSGGAASAETITERWYNERVTGGSCMGHYTQVVWKKSVKFCMATAESRRGGSYTVARYFPAGNHVGARNYQENVHPEFKDPCSMFQPSINKPKPSFNTPRPSFNTPRPSFNTPRPSFNTPRPSFNTPRPSFNTPKPSIITERPTNAPANPSGQSGFAEAGLKAHNTRRQTSPHYGTLLVLDDKLCKDAQSYADLLAKRDSGLQHAKGTGQGENLSWQSSGWWTKAWGKDGVSAEEITEGWYEERVTGGSCAGHYTQVVWKKSVKFCMAMAESRSGGTFTVARYLPPGNFNGAKNYRANVHQGFVRPC